MLKQHIMYYVTVTIIWDTYFGIHNKYKKQYDYHILNYSL